MVCRFEGISLLQPPLPGKLIRLLFLFILNSVFMSYFRSGSQNSVLDTEPTLSLSPVYSVLPTSDMRMWKWTSYHQSFLGRSKHTHTSSSGRLSQKKSYNGEKSLGRVKCPWSLITVLYLWTVKSFNFPSLFAQQQTSHYDSWMACFLLWYRRSNKTSIYPTTPAVSQPLY